MFNDSELFVQRQRVANDVTEAARGRREVQDRIDDAAHDRPRCRHEANEHVRLLRLAGRLIFRRHHKFGAASGSNNRKIAHTAAITAVGIRFCASTSMCGGSLAKGDTAQQKREWDSGEADDSHDPERVDVG